MVNLWQPGLKQIVPSQAVKYCPETRCGKIKILRNHSLFKSSPFRPGAVAGESDNEMCEGLCPVAL